MPTQHQVAICKDHLRRRNPRWRWGILWEIPAPTHPQIRIAVENQLAQIPIEVKLNWTLTVIFREFGFESTIMSFILEMMKKKNTTRRRWLGFNPNLQEMIQMNKKEGLHTHYSTWAGDKQSEAEIKANESLSGEKQRCPGFCAMSDEQSTIKIATHRRNNIFQLWPIDQRSTSTACSRTQKQ